MKTLGSSAICLRLIPKLVYTVIGILFILTILNRPVSAADEFVGEGIVMEINHEKGEIVILEKYFFLRKGQKKTWQPQIIDKAGKSIMFEAFGVHDVVQIKAQMISKDKYKVEQLTMLIDNPSPEKQEAGDSQPQESGASNLHLDNGVWKNS